MHRCCRSAAAPVAATTTCVDGVPITDMRNRASANPSIEAHRRRGGAGAHLRCGDGRDWRRHVQRGHQVGHQRLARQRLLPEPTRVGREKQLSSRSWPACRSPTRTSTSAAAPSAAPSSGTARSSGSRPKATDRTRRAAATCGSRPAASGAATSPRRSMRQGQLVVIYDPADGRCQRQRPTAVSRQRHSRRIASTPWPGRSPAICRCPDRDVSDGNNNFTRTAEIHDRAIMYTGKVDHRFSDSVSLTGFYLYNKTDEPCANYWEPGLRARIGSRIPATTSASGA